MSTFIWTCPFCNHDTTIGNDNFSSDTSDLAIKNTDGYRRLCIDWIVCPNEGCQKISLKAELYKLNPSDFATSISQWLTDQSPISTWKLIPNSTAKPFPDYIPLPIRVDYEEACSIVDLSPKASATLSRRCLQGMIRDFWGVSKSKLVDEINGIRDKVDALTWGAIDAVRKVGNIGAHMEKDINLIIDVDPTEAFLLIQLIELLIKEWYIHRHEREVQLHTIIALSTSKEFEKRKI